MDRTATQFQGLGLFSSTHLCQVAEQQQRVHRIVGVLHLPLQQRQLQRRHLRLQRREAVLGVVDLCVILDRAGAAGVLEGVDRLVDVCVCSRHARDHHRLGVAAQRVL